MATPITQFAPLPSPLNLIATLDDVVGDLNASDLSRLADAELRTLLADVERVTRKMTVASHAVLTECSDRGSYSRWGYKRLSHMLIGELKISAGDAARRLRVAAATVGMRSLTGQITEPRHPDIAEAVFEGSISEHHADEILKVLEKIPAAASPEQEQEAEATMVDVATTLNPRDVARVGDRLLAHLDPDGELTTDGDRARRRKLSLSPQDAAMMSKLSAELDPATRAMLDVLLDAWSAPGMNNPDDPESPAGSYSDPGTDRDAADAAAKRDLRSAPQRRHDALSAMLSRFISSGSIGSHRGSPAQVVVTMTYDQLLQHTGLAETMSGALIPVLDAIELAKANSMFMAILDADDVPLYLGRTKRLATVAQRIAMWLREHGCTFPGCPNPATWSQAHHATDWAKGGLTDIDALASACTDHHPMVGDGPEQWQTEILTAGAFRGRCAWIPPASIDPDRKPRVNSVHHPEELLDQARTRVANRNRLSRGDPWTS